MERKKILPLLSLAIIVIIFAVILLNYFGVSIHSISQVSCGCQDRIPVHYYLLFGIILIIVSIPIIYYYVSKKMEKKLRDHVKSLSKIVNKNQKKKDNFSNGNDLLKFLNQTEQKIVKILLKNNGEVLQSQISKSNNLTKLKVHRAIKSLVQKNVVNVKRYGKTNKVNLTKEFKKSFKF